MPWAESIFQVWGQFHFCVSNNIMIMPRKGSTADRPFIFVGFKSLWLTEIISTLIWLHSALLKVNSDAVLKFCSIHSSACAMAFGADVSQTGLWYRWKLFLSTPSQVSDDPQGGLANNGQRVLYQLKPAMHSNPIWRSSDMQPVIVDHWQIYHESPSIHLAIDKHATHGSQTPSRYEKSISFKLQLVSLSELYL